MNWRSTLLVMALLVCGCDGLRLDPERTLASIEIVPRDTLILEGQPVQLRVIARDADGEIIDIPEWRKPRWHSDTPEIIKVSGDRVIGLAGGKAQVSVSLSGVSGSAQVRVNPLWDVSATGIYITQVAQHPPEPIPLIANRQGLLRVFLTFSGFHAYTPPEIRVVLSGSGMLTDTVLTQAFPEVMETPDESELRFSYNLHLPGERIQPGLRAAFTYDPNNRQNGLQGSQRIGFDVRTLPTYRQVIVPVINTNQPTENSTRWARAQSDESAEMQLARHLLPMAERVVTAREPYTTDADFNNQNDNLASNGWNQLLGEIKVLWRLDNTTDYYYGVMDLSPGNPGLGLADGSIPVSIGEATDETFTHEVGHNMGLSHAPGCSSRVKGVDPDYPYRSGSIGYWGWHPGTDQLMDPTKWADIMSYCNDLWISWYHFERASRWRETYELGNDPARSVEPVLLVWGSITDAGLALEPALQLNGPASRPDGGPYLAEGFGMDGERVFSHRFTPSAISHSDDRLFNVMIPYDPARSPHISSITVSGGGHVATLAEGSHAPVAVIFDKTTNRVTAIRRNWQGEVPTGARAVYSTGLPPGGIIR